MIPIPSPLVEFILLGPLDDRRQLQDSPILGDVWVEFGKVPGEPLDLLIAPYRGEHAGVVAAKIDDGVEGDANVAYLQGLIVAQLTFEELARVVVPKTKWWLKRWSTPEVETPKKTTKKRTTKTSATEEHELQKYTRQKAEQLVSDILSLAREWNSKKSLRRLPDIPALDRFIALTGLILWAGAHDVPATGTGSSTTSDQITNILSEADPADIAARLVKLAGAMLSDKTRAPLVWQVSLNRVAMPALTKSVGAVKADAATTLFKVDCSDITWAVLDSGIDGNHPAFKTGDGKTSRVKRAFDFKNFRKIVSLSNSKKVVRDQNIQALKDDGTWAILLNPPDDPAADLEQLAKDAIKRGPIQWEIVSRYVEIKPGTPPSSNHGTHVAGIIGANKNGALKATEKASDDYADGMCPDIQLYDFRVLGRDIKDTEFAIIAALQFIRHLNDRDNFLAIQGANLSLSIPHDVRNFACGRTPICDECERLIETGIVVVAAAGNHGYKSFETKDGSYDSYAAFSITDPGNADSVITVGATHRFWPHTYGVSFFSSRGPTGDGRIKPDLVAPGEKIHAPLPNGEWGDLDGTSMAAPHVSGAAAMLMARYSELIQHPRLIKKILCDSATDLGRERTFQGKGMLDVLRAFQSV